MQVMVSETSRRIGRRLRQARVDAGMRQRDVAAAMGMDPPLEVQRISDWERGVNTAPGVVSASIFAGLCVGCTGRALVLSKAR